MLARAVSTILHFMFDRRLARTHGSLSICDRTLVSAGTNVSYY